MYARPSTTRLNTHNTKTQPRCQVLSTTLPYSDSGPLNDYDYTDFFIDDSELKDAVFIDD